MTTSNVPKPDALFTEAPVSWNTRYVTPEGFECQLTLRGESGQEVLEKARAALDYLLRNDCIPSTFNKGNGHQPKTNGEAEMGGNANGNNGHDPSFCPIHGCSMKRWQKDGRTWFSHKVDGQWCSGKAKSK